MTNMIQNLNSLLLLIKYPLFTEKSSKFLLKNRYTFIVDRKLKKPIIKILLENIFKIKIIKINTLILPINISNKLKGKKPNYKKVIITLDKNSKIENLFN